MHTASVPHAAYGKKLFIVALVAMLALGALGAVILSPSKAHAAAKLKISSASQKGVKGKTFTLKVKNAGGKKVTWKSSNKKVASISKKGIVVAKKAGTATITAKIGSKKLTCKVKVYGSAKQKALASLNGWWHTWSSGGGYRYIKNGKIYFFSVGIDSDGMFYDSTSHVRKEKLSLVRVKHAPLGDGAAYLVKANGKTAYCYNDNTHDELSSWDGTNYSGGGSLYRINSSEVPPKLKKYAKRF